MTGPTIIQPPGPIVVSSNSRVFLEPLITLPTDQPYIEYIITGYQWNKGGVDIDCATLRTYTIPFAHVSDSGTYTLCVTYMYSLIVSGNIVSTYGSTCSSNGTAISVLDPITIISYTSNRYIVPTTPPNNNFTLTVIATGSSPVYTWHTPTGIVTGSNTYTVNPALIINQGNYSVTVSNSISTATSSIIYIDIVEPPIILVNPLSQNIVFGQPVTFSVTATGEYLEYQWYKNTIPIIDASSSVYTIAVTGLSDAGSYTVDVSNIAGHVTSTSAILVIYTVPEILYMSITVNNEMPIICTENTEIKINDGSSVYLTVTLDRPELIYEYIWYKDGIAVSPPNDAPGYLVSSSLILNNTGNYTVNVSNIAGSVTSIIIHVIVVALPIIISGPTPHTQLVIVNQRMYLNIVVTGGCIVYQWRHKGVDIPGATNALYSVICRDNTYAGDYDVVISNIRGTIISELAYVFYTQSNEDAGGAGIINAAVGSNMASGITDAKIKAAAKCFIQISIFKTKESQCCPSGPIIPFGQGGTTPSALIQQQIQRQLICTEATNKALILQRQSVPACPAVDLRFVKYQRRGPMAVPMPPPPGVIIPSNPGVPTAVNGPCVNVIGISTTRF